MHPAQRRAGIDTQLVDESFTHLPVGLEGVGLPAAAVLGEHQLPGQAFVERMGVQCRGELHKQLVCRPARSATSLRSSATESRSASSAVRTSFTHGVSSEAKGSPRHRSSALSNTATASRGSAVARHATEAAETVQVDRQRIRRQHVTARLAGDHDVLGVRQQCPKPGKVARHRISSAVRRLVAHTRSAS